MGVDPGSRITGYGIIEEIGSSQLYVASGCIHTDPKSSLPDRIYVIHKGLCEVIEKYNPTISAIEQVFVNKNPASSLMLGQARGACITSLVSHNLPVFEYTALQVKQAVVGMGKAQKQQVQRMVVELLQLNGVPPEDAADALAVALTHAFRNIEKDLGIPGRFVVKGGRYVHSKY